MRPRFYLGISVLCVALLAVAVWLQQHDYPPCPLCILQRIAYLLTAFFCVLAAAIRPVRLALHALALLSSIGGLAIAAHHVWVLYHPTISCGIDPLETALNKLPLAQWAPWLFQADGLCAAPLPPVLGLPVPVWSLVWLTALALTLGVTLLRRRPV